MSRSYILVASAFAVLIGGACGRPEEPQTDGSLGAADKLREHVHGLGCVMVSHPTQYFTDTSFECRRTIRRTPCCSVHLMVDASSDGTGSNVETISRVRFTTSGCDDEEAISYGVSLLAPLLTEDERDALDGFVRRPRIARERLTSEDIDLEQTRMIGHLHVTAGFQGGATKGVMPRRHVTIDRYTRPGVREVASQALLRHSLLDTLACPAGT